MNCQQDLRDGLARMVVISIGPTTSEELAHHGVKPDFEPSRPKMGFLVNEAAQYSGKVLQEKRSGAEPTAAPVCVAVTTHLQASGSAAEPQRAPTEPVRRVAVSTPTMAGFRDGLTPIDFLHEISSRIAAADSFHVVLGRIVDFVTAIIPCDSCFIYVLEGEKLVLRVSQNPHADLVDQLGLQIGHGVTGWVAEHMLPDLLHGEA